MSSTTTPKSSTCKISLIEPDENQVLRQLVGREVSAALFQFLKGVLKTKKWTRKVNIPSGHDDLAAVLSFTAALKQGGFEIFSELHVFYVDRAQVEKWQVCGEDERIGDLPKEVFRAIEIKRVSAMGSEVRIKLNVPKKEGQYQVIERVFDFSNDEPSVRIVPHPALENP
jgi:hypothetical protein